MLHRFLHEKKYLFWPIFYSFGHCRLPKLVAKSVLKILRGLPFLLDGPHIYTHTHIYMYTYIICIYTHLCVLAVSHQIDPSLKSMTGAIYDRVKSMTGCNL